MDSTTSSDVETQVMAAIRKAMIEAPVSDQALDVCVNSPQGETIAKFKLPSYALVEKLAAELRHLGYAILVMHPENTKCDFVLQPVKRA